MLKPFLAPPLMLALAEGTFPQPKSLVVADATAGDFTELLLLVAAFPQPKLLVVADVAEGDFMVLVCGVGAADSVLAHASLDPQGSDVEKPEKELLVGGADDWTAGWYCVGGFDADRLKTEATLVDGFAGLADAID